MMVLPLIKTKAGFTLLQILRFWSILRILKNSGRFNFNQSASNFNTQNITTDEAYKILNLEPKKNIQKNKF